MRDEPGGRNWSPTIVILVVNLLMFLLEASGGRHGHRVFQEYGALSLEGIQRGFVWQFVTFQFMHGGELHLVMNSIGLYMFGRHMESMLGRSTFLKLYLISGVVGGVFQILLAMGASRFAAPMVGASAGICGLIAAFSFLNPEAVILLFFVIPLRAKYIYPLTVVLSVVFLFLPDGGGVAHGAHLGGTIFGYAYVRWLSSSEIVSGWWAVLAGKLRGSRRSRPIVKVRFPSDGGSWETEHSKPKNESGDFITKEVDPILEKISAHGIHSLTEEERRILEAARNRMGKR
jgi:membrane associated rhomboid family serine protease